MTQRPNSKYSFLAEINERHVYFVEIVNPINMYKKIVLDGLKFLKIVISNAKIQNWLSIAGFIFKSRFSPNE